MWLANIPVYGIYSWFAVQARHVFFFSNVNPGIPLGGAVGESKYDILQRIPNRLRPKTLMVSGDAPFAEVEAQMRAAGLKYPVIAKPDVGERGFLVRKVAHEAELREHLERYRVPFLIQEFLDHPVEMTVLFHRFPDDGRFGISSVCMKEFLSVQGDGVSTVRQLMARNYRAAFQLARFEREFPELMNRVPAAGEALLLEPIGNHARGTKFLNANHLVDREMELRFREICTEIDGVLFGRFDLKCESVEALRRGEFQVMELNGVFAEPAHVYDPAHGMWRVYRDYYRHWRIMFELYRAQMRLGVRPTPHREAWHFIRQYLRYKNELEAL